MTRAQLLEAGLARSAVYARIAAGQLFAEHAGVYSVGYRRVEPVARATAAVLACGPTAVLSHESAAALWGMRRWPPRHEVTVTTDRRRPGIVVHRSRTLTAADVTVQLGVRTTTAARALRDIRGRLTERQRVRLANDARLRRLIGADQFAALVDHRRNPTRSGGEDDFQRFVERYGLPQPHTSFVIGRREVDTVFAEERVIVEIDHLATHGDPMRFVDDRARDAEHAAAGYVTVRIIAEALGDDPEGHARRLRAILEARREVGGERG